ncbi:MAG: 4Fe-4S binding protein [Nanoarchaeota archaeon]
MLSIFAFLPMAAHAQDMSDGSSADMQSDDGSDIGMDMMAGLVAFVFMFLLVAGMILFMRGIAGKDLLEYKTISRLMKSRWYPGILQFPTLVFFGFIGYFFFFGPVRYADNPGSVLSWTLWWPLVPITFILFGRLWCAICPFPVIGDFFQRFVQPTRKPGEFLVKYGIWITDGIFLAITLFDRLYGMVDTPWLSGTVFVLILFGVIIMSVQYERRTFCKHVCFLGGVSGNYSMLSGLSLESRDKAVCAVCKVKGCYFGSGHTPGCPYFAVMPSKQGMRDCTLCANCVKNCPKDNIALRTRSIASELWSHARVSFSESFFAKLMVGVVIIQNLGMLAVWGDLQMMLEGMGLGPKASIIVLYAAAIALPLIFMTITSAISSRLESEPSSTILNFAAFGYAFIPIDVAGHVAHNLSHLLGEGKSIIGAFLGLITGKVASEGAFAGVSEIRGMQLAIVAAGGLGTLYVGYRIARAREKTTFAALKILLPHFVLLIVIFGINLLLFSQSMGHRGG